MHISFKNIKAGLVQDFADTKADITAKLATIKAFFKRGELKMKVSENKIIAFFTKEFNDFKVSMSVIKVDVKEQETRLKGFFEREKVKMEADIASLQTEVTNIKSDSAAVKAEVATKLAALEALIKKV